MQNKCLVIVHREHAKDDFEQIKRRIFKKDQSIHVVLASNYITSKMIPENYHRMPMLVIYLVKTAPIEFKVAKKLAVKKINKIEEYELFRDAGIPCLPITKFQWGVGVDEAEYGEWVVLKPSKTQSTGQYVHRIRAADLPKIDISMFSENHPIKGEDFYVQRFIKTGQKATHYRVNLFLKTILYSSINRRFDDYPENNISLTEMLSKSVASNQNNQREIKLHIDDEVNQLALKVSELLSIFPLIGLDIIRDELTKKLYVLEGNLGGNTWHFSSDIGKELRFAVGGKNQIVRQYMAWDRAAEALISATHELAT